MLYLDFPLGVNRDGYDVWRERELFALNANGGAPPDGLFVKGQNWGFPPVNPEALRQPRIPLLHPLRASSYGFGRHAAYRSRHGFAPRFLGAGRFQRHGGFVRSYPAPTNTGRY